jgi:hypothetical protein
VQGAQDDHQQCRPEQPLPRHGAMLAAGLWPA